MPDTTGLPLGMALALFAASGAAIAFLGWRVVGLADRLADRTGLGEALFGALFLGGATSLAGLVVSFSSAWHGYPTLAVSNCLGGIAAQTAFLALADMAYRRANLEHAAASAESLTQSTLLVALLALPLLGMTLPAYSLFGLSPVTAALPLAYVVGQRLVQRAHAYPMWHPRETTETQADVPDPTPPRERLSALWLSFGLHAAGLVASGYALTLAAERLAGATGLSETLIGGLLTAVVTSLPELIVAIAAVRRGALALAVGNILGGNCFDVLFIAAADAGYREGSIYAALDERTLGLLALNLLLTSVVMLGLLGRERHGPGNIGLESVLVLVFYVGGFTLVALA